MRTLETMMLELRHLQADKATLVNEIKDRLLQLRASLQSITLSIENADTIDPWEHQERANLEKQIITTEIELEQFHP